MSIRQPFNHHPDAIASIQHASKSPPAPWARVYIAAKLAETIAMRTGETGDHLGKLGMVDINKIRETINAARIKAETGNLWTNPEEAREELAMLASTFANVRIGLGIMNKNEAFHGIASSIAETGTAYIRSMRAAPDAPLPSKASFMTSPYRANPLVAMDTAAVMAYHASGFLEELGQPLDMLPAPYNLPKTYLEDIHKHGFRGIEPRDCFQDTMMKCIVGLRILDSNTQQLLRKKTILAALKERLDVHTLLATTNYLVNSFTPPSKNQRVEYEKTCRPAADVIDFHTRRLR